MLTEKENAELSRRKFLKGSLVVGASGLVAGLAGCSAAAETSTTESAAGTDTTVSSMTGTTSSTTDCNEKYSFEIPPEPIADADIKATQSADVVILGAGIAGFCAAIAAKRGGANVVVLEKRNTYMAHGGWNGVIGDRQHEAEGVELPEYSIVNELMRFAAFHNNQKLIQVWQKQSGRVMNELLDIADGAGISYRIATDVKSWASYQEFPTAVQFLPAMQMTLMGMLEQYMKDNGIEILYETPAVQLVKDDSGKITAVIAQNADGYLKVEAAKAVIICTGCYGSNKEMLEKYAPRALKCKSSMYHEGSNTGDGHMMGMWVGGVMQETSCPMLWDGMIEGNPMFISIARQPFLYVNKLGERYATEDAPYGYTANQDILQPDSEKWTIWDANWKTDVEKFGGTVCENMDGSLPFWTDESYDAYKENGTIIEADTLDELADKMGVPKETFLATVSRYNELVEKGVDEDFCKDPKKLTAIVQPPFGAIKVGTGILVTVDGLKINPDMQVLDANGSPIPGLYAAGNASGDFFANDYPILVTGVSHGRALTFGWIAGENAAKL